MAKRKFEVELAGKAVWIEELPTRKQEAWREKVFQSDLSQLFKSFQAVTSLDTNNLGEMSASIVSLITPIFQQGPEVMVDLIHDYCPQLSIDFLMDECYEPELINAFVVVVRLAFPFESLMKTMQNLSIGPQIAPILKNSPSVNGESKTPIQHNLHSSNNTAVAISDESDTKRN